MKNAIFGICVTIICLFLIPSCVTKREVPAGVGERTASVGAGGQTVDAAASKVDLRGAKVFLLEPFTVDLQSVGGGTIPITATVMQATDGAQFANGSFAVHGVPASALDAARTATYVDECLFAVFKNSPRLKLRNFRPDAVLHGTITDFSDAVIHNADFSGYARAVSLTVTYRVVSKTGAVLAERMASVGAISDFVAEPSLLPPLYSVIEIKIPMIAQKVLEDLTNDDATRRVSLIAYKRGKIMRAAYKQFQKGEYSVAKELYLQAYNTQHLFEAGYNAARIMQIKGEFEEARRLMTALFETYKDKRAAIALRDIERELNTRKSKPIPLPQEREGALKRDIPGGDVAFLPFNQYRN